MHPAGNSESSAGTISVSGGLPVTIVLAGDFDLDDADRLDTVFTNAGDGLAHGQIVRLDLGAVTFCSSSTLTCLLRFHRRLRSGGNTLDVVALSSVMQRLLELTGTSRFWATPSTN